MRPVDRRLLRQAGAARGYLALAVVLGLAVTGLILAQAALLAHALAAEGVQCTPPFGSLLYKGEVFQKHGFFAGRWPIKELGLTTMDYTKVSCPKAEEILATDVTLTFHESMTEEHVLLMAKAIEKVARAYAV